MFAILKTFVLKEATLETAILDCTRQPGCAYVTSFCTNQNCQEGEKTSTDLVYILHKVSKMCFFQAIIHFTIFTTTCMTFGVRSMFDFKQYSSRIAISQPRVVVKWLTGSHWDQISWTDWHHKNTAWPLSTVQNGGNNFELWVSLETNFIRKTCPLEAETLVTD